MAATPPSSIAGGCLCGAIRYSISFPPGAEWPPTGNPTCQCTRCRKFTGSLAAQLIGFPTANISPPLSSQAAYRPFATPAGSSASEGAGAGAIGGGSRIFCGTCGSSIGFVHQADNPPITEIHAGTLDEDVLCGEVTAREGEGETEDGGGVAKRSGGFGAALCGNSAHVWLENAVHGVTDLMPGDKWERSRNVSRLRG